MKKIGLTGGIGSGKSYVADYFKSLGIPVYNSDERGRILNDSHPTIVKSFKDRFGKEIYKEGRLDRKKVADIVFNDKDELHWINNLVHPIVREDYNSWIQSQSSQLIIREAAILIESGSYKECDKLIVVTAPLDIRIERVVRRDGLSETQVLQRISNQMNDDERKGYADFVVINDGLLPIESQVDNILKQLL